MQKTSGFGIGTRGRVGVADFCGFPGVCGRWVFCMGLISTLGCCERLRATPSAERLSCRLSPGATLGGR